MHGSKGVQDVAFRPAQRRKAQARELRLQLTDIVPAERHVVSEIPGAGKIVFMKRRRTLQQG